MTRLVVPLALVAALVVPSAARAQRQGIAYSVDTTPDRSPAVGIYSALGGRVTFAAGRGRWDVTSKREAPTLVAGGIAIAPLAMPGDYYLFDSTGFVLVRPRAKTFSSFGITGASFNYHNGRDGWPAIFDFEPILRWPVTAADSEAVRQHGEIHIYWHLDLNQGSPSFAVVARGLMTLRDAPPSEVGAARWFGPSEAIAKAPDLADLIASGTVAITMAVPLKAVGANAQVINFIARHDVSNLESVTVDLATLMLPDGYTETAWPRFEQIANRPPLSLDGGSRWRRPPGTR